MRHTISLMLVLAAFWLLNSGHYTPLLFFLAICSIALVILISHRMDVIDHESQPLHLTMYVPGYWLWLIKEIVLANLDVTYRIWHGNSSISPTRTVLKMEQNTDMGKVIYANSITLTPGTVAMDLDGDRLVVHALTKKAVEDLHTGEMGRRVRRLEG
ncbi:MAG TPA: Na+/H+ antiporter subunit E [Gammaproteobacteria bacterium]